LAIGVLQLAIQPVEMVIVNHPTGEMIFPTKIIKNQKPKAKG